MSEPTGQSDLDRVVFFSDAVFAIAITLLVVELGVPHVPQAELRSALWDLWPKVGAFFLSFAVIGLYWIAHRRTFRHIRAVDSRLIVLNLAFLALIAFQPFPTSVFGSYGSTTAATVLYAGSLALTGFALAAVWAYAWRAKLVTVGQALARRILLRSLVAPVVFSVSIPVALVSPEAAKWTWLAMVPLNRLLPTADGHEAFE